MKVYLLREARIRHHAGEIVEVSPDEAGYLISTGSAESMEAAAVPVVPVREIPEKKTAAKETPEKATVKRTVKK